MSKLVEHAVRELGFVYPGLRFEYLSGDGFPEAIPTDPKYSDDAWYVNGLIRVVVAFSKAGHSGGTAHVALMDLTKLLNYDNFTPLTRNPDEWTDVSDTAGRPLWQNIRNSKYFSEDGGKTWTNLVDGAAEADEHY